MTHHHDLIRRMVAELDHYRQLVTDDRREVHPLAEEARAALAQSEPEVVGPTYDDLSVLCAEHGLDTDSWPTEEFDALWEVSRAILSRWGNHPAKPDSSIDGPAVPEGREPAAVTAEATDEELKAAYWEAYRETAMCGAEASWLAGLRAVANLSRPALTQPEPEGRPAPAPAGEVGELVRQLGSMAANAEAADWICDAAVLDLAIKHLETLNPSQPVPPAEGEVADLAEFLRIYGDHVLDEYGDLGEHDQLTRAADLLERQAAPVPVAVSERLPEPGVKVLAHYFNDLGKGRTICAIWVPAKSRSNDFDSSDDDFTEYDEETDKFYWPEGWYEAIENWEDLGYVKVDEGDVIYWQPLPQWPAHALPLPNGEME